MHLELPWPSFRYSHAVLKNCGKVIGEVIFLGQLCITEVDFFAALDGTGSIQCCLYGELCVTIHPWLLSVGQCEFHDIALWYLWVKLWSRTPMGQQVKLLFLSCVINPKAMQQNKSKDIYYYSTSNRTAMKAKTCPYLLLETTELQGVVHGKTQLPWSSYELLSPIQFASISAVSSLRLLQSSVVSLIYNTCWVHMKHCGVCINFWSTTSGHRQLVSLVQIAENSYLSAPHHTELIERQWGSSTHITIEEVKKRIPDLLQQYIRNGDTTEACRCIRE